MMPFLLPWIWGTENQDYETVWHSAQLENETWSVVFKSIQILSLALKLVRKTIWKSDLKCKEQFFHQGTPYITTHTANICPV